MPTLPQVSILHHNVVPGPVTSPLCPRSPGSYFHHAFDTLSALASRTVLRCIILHSIHTSFSHIKLTASHLSPHFGLNSVVTSRFHTNLYQAVLYSPRFQSPKAPLGRSLHFLKHYCLLILNANRITTPSTLSY